MMQPDGQVAHMSDSGVDIRLRRLMTDGHSVIVPMDHGITQGPVRGLVDLEETVSAVVEGGADAVLTHRGNATRVVDSLATAGFIVHLNASTTIGPDANDKRQVSSVEAALARGADAVSYHINVGSEHEPRQLVELGRMTETAHQFGLPALAMAYPRGPDVDERSADAVAHAVRVASELDADLIKTTYPREGFDRAVAATDRPVLIAGGEPDDDRATLEMVAKAMADGAAGVSIGRTIFQHDDPGAITAAIAAIVHDGASTEQASRLL